MFFYHFLSCLVVSLRWQALPQQFAEDSVYCSGAKAVVGRGVRLSLSSLNDEITHATVVMIVGKHVSLCGYGEVCAFAFRVSRVSPEKYQRIYSSWGDGFRNFRIRYVWLDNGYSTDVRRCVWQTLWSWYSSVCLFVFPVRRVVRRHGHFFHDLS